MREKEMKKSKEKVVFVDDNINILRYFELFYRVGPYEILTFNNPIEALNLLNHKNVAAVITDQALSGMKGTTFLERVKEILPDTERILMTSYEDEKAVMAVLNRGDIYHLIRKPLDVREMNLIIRNAVMHYKLVRENKRLIQFKEKQIAEMETLNDTLKREFEAQIETLRKEGAKQKETLTKLHNMLESTISAMQLTVESKDPYTAGHQMRVANLAHAIATEMGLSVDQIDGLSMAGAIHDIGKVYEPEEILNKPGHLTDTEFDMIKTHPKVGYDLLKQIEFSWPVASIVLQHHERMDGSGYPSGISGDDILLESRIMAVADVVEAMVSRRSYREALSIDNALEEIERNKGVLYDTHVTDACLRLFNEKGFRLN